MAANICMILYFALTLQSQNRNNLTGWFCRQELSCGVMVARRILVPPVRVRILPRQHKKRVEQNSLALFFQLVIKFSNC